MVDSDTAGRPGWPGRTFQVQNSSKPLRCQPMTFRFDNDLRTIASRSKLRTAMPKGSVGGRQSGPFTERRSTVSWCRSARFSRLSVARDLKAAEAADANMEGR